MGRERNRRLLATVSPGKQSNAGGQLTDNELVEWRGNRALLAGRRRQLQGLSGDEADRRAKESTAKVYGWD